MADQAQRREYYCQYCSQPLHYIHEYGDWYCYSCRRYSQESQAGYGPTYETGEYPRTKTEPPKTKSNKVKVGAVAATIIIIIILILAVFSFPPDGQEPEEEEEKTVTIYNVSELRNLKVLNEVPMENMTRAELEEYLEDQIDDELLAQWEEARLILDALFLLDYSENLTKILLDTYSSEILGFYNTEDKKIFIIDGEQSVYDRVTMAHELTHALQDQHFNLSNFEESENSDEVSAWEAMVEGDATLTQMFYLGSLSKAEFDAYFDEADKRSDPSSDDIPFPIKEIMTFPYAYGFFFVWEIYNQSGWKSVNDLYNNPPASTEQIMHVDKYFESDRPMSVSLQIDIPSMELVISDIMGEFIIYTMLDHYLPKNTATDAAEGWGGDVFNYYKNETDFLSVLKIKWDNQMEASDFYDAYLEWADNLPDEYKREWTDERLQITLSQQQRITTIYYSSDPDIIQSIM